MNAHHLLALVERLNDDEAEIKIQEALGSLNKSLNNYVANPQDAAHQVAVSEQLNELKRRIGTLRDKYDPAQLSEIEEIGGGEFFGPSLFRKIETSISENQLSPAVVQNLVSDLVESRSEYIAKLKLAQSSLQALGIKPDALENGTAEIGFRLPEELFSGNLDGLIKELSAIKNIITAFSELSTGAAEKIVVGEISSSDPLFFFGLDPVTVAQLAATVTWALHTWKKLEDIRKIRAETSKLTSFSAEEVENIFGDKIRKTIDEAVTEKANELVDAKVGAPGRPHELRNKVEWALEGIFARVERGMTVEVRFLPPPETPAGEATETEEATAAAFGTLSEVSQQLVFPRPEEKPALELPPTEPNPEGGREKRKGEL